jgi:hypothetical protein
MLERGIKGKMYNEGLLSVYGSGGVGLELHRLDIQWNLGILGYLELA